MLPPVRFQGAYVFQSTPRSELLDLEEERQKILPQVESLLADVENADGNHLKYALYTSGDYYKQEDGQLTYELQVLTNKDAWQVANDAGIQVSRSDTSDTFQRKVLASEAQEFLDYAIDAYIGYKEAVGNFRSFKLLPDDSFEETYFPDDAFDPGEESAGGARIYGTPAENEDAPPARKSEPQPDLFRKFLEELDFTGFDPSQSQDNR